MERLSCKLSVVRKAEDTCGSTPFMKKPEQKKLGCLGLNSRETLLLEWPETAEVHSVCVYA